METYFYNGTNSEEFFDGDKWGSSVGKYIENPEYLAAWLDADDKVIFGLKTDGKTYVGDADFLNKINNNQESISEIKSIIDKIYKSVKKVSILGDSISTFNQEGFRIDGYAMYYPTEPGDRGADVVSVEDTWWKQVIDNEDSIIEINASYSGSTASNLSIGFSPRVPLLGNPDVIYIALGTNDSGNGVEIGSIDFNATEYDLSKFAPAYIKGIQDTLAAYPKAEVICVAFDMGIDYQNAIHTIAKHYGLKYYYVGDISDVHPNKAEMKAVADVISGNFTFLENDSDYLEAKIDIKGRVLSGRTRDGKAFENVGFDTPEISIDGVETKTINDEEGRSEITIDSEGKIISYRDAAGIKHENVGIKPKRIYLEEAATQDLIDALNALGYNAKSPIDWSESELVEIPIPTVCAVVNLGVDSQANTKDANIPTTIEFWDKNGNYFKKPIELNAQGSSSMSYNIKNQAIDFADGSKIKFGNWLAFDSFHLKKYFIDVFRGQCIVCYRLGEQVYQTRPVCKQRPWSYMNNNTAIDAGLGSFDKDFNNEAMAHPDGFPIHLFFNGKDAGIYTFNIKKDRSNYNCKKNTQKHIILDGVLGSVFWNANGNLNQQGQTGESIWNDFEVRNPKIATDINGNKYDGDHPTEPSNDYAACKAYISRLTTYKTAINAESTIEAKKAKCEEFFNVPFFIDYDLIGQITYNYDGYGKNWIWLTNDGNIWSPTIYDMDSVFGQHWNGASYVENSEIGTPGLYPDMPTGVIYGLYQAEYEARYKELRDKGIFTVDNICGLFKEWLDACGQSNLKNDIENIVVSPYIENGEVVKDEQGNPILIPNTPSYRDGSKEYVYQPTVGGWYNSLQRVYNWLVARIAFLDTHYNYNQN